MKDKKERNQNGKVKTKVKVVNKDKKARRVLSRNKAEMKDKKEKRVKVERNKVKA